MRIFLVIRFLLALAALVFFIRFLQKPLSFGEANLPPLGNFFNPFSGFWRNAELAVATPGAPSELNLPGLKEPVEVVFDDNMVPHIFAKNIEDAVMAQGYVTAQLRLWQMDMSARAASGRLSEIMGEKTLDFDRLTRRQGMLWAAEIDVKSWESSPQYKAILDAYTAGVNAYIATLKPQNLPLEFKLLNYQPEPWTNLKTALVNLGMARNLCMREDDLEATNTLAALGPETFNYLFPARNPNAVPIVPFDENWANFRPDSTSGVSQVIENQFFKIKNQPQSGWSSREKMPLPSDLQPLDGSNNWALSATKTASGKAILANDPHLGLSLPSVWFQTHIVSPLGNCQGVALPGVPGIIIGFNENIAWGLTNVSQDVLDWYQIRWTDESRTSYLFDGQPKKAELKMEEIKIKDKPAILDTVRYTVWGPVTYDHEPENGLRDCAMRWIAHDRTPADHLNAFFKLNTGKNYADYRSAIANFDCPAQNFLFASQTGDIAITVNGKIPLRASEQGRYVQDGSQSAKGWQGFVPMNQVPIWKNPSRGYLFSSNQESTGAAYPFHYLGGFDDWRNLRISNRLDSMRNATVDSMKTMQLDNFSARAARLLPVFLKTLDRSGLSSVENGLLNQLENWNFKYEKDLVAPTLFEVWTDSAYRATWDEIWALEEKGQPVLFPETWRWAEVIERDTANVFFDKKSTPQRETARDVVTEGFKKMASKMSTTLPTDLAWGKHRGLKINHLTRLDAFSRSDVLVGGTGNAPNAINRSHGPSWRMIVEFETPIRAVGIYPGGQSGNPGSPFYDNMINDWAEGNYRDLRLFKAAAEVEKPLKKQVFTPSKK